MIDWQDGDRVRVVLVASFIRDVSKEQHEQHVQAALDATARLSPAGPGSRAACRNTAETPETVPGKRRLDRGGHTVA